MKIKIRPDDTSRLRENDWVQTDAGSPSSGTMAVPSRPAIATPSRRAAAIPGQKFLLRSRPRPG